MWALVGVFALKLISKLIFFVSIIPSIKSFPSFRSQSLARLYNMPFVFSWKSIPSYQFSICHNLGWFWNDLYYQYLGSCIGPHYSHICTHLIISVVLVICRNGRPSKSRFRCIFVLICHSSDSVLFWFIDTIKMVSRFVLFIPISVGFVVNRFYWSLLRFFFALSAMQILLKLLVLVSVIFRASCNSLYM